MNKYIFYIVLFLIPTTFLSQSVQEKRRELENAKHQIGSVIHSSPESVTKYLHRGIQLSIELGDSNSLGHFFIQRGLFYITLSESDKAVSSFFEAKKLYERTHNISGVATAYANLGLYSNVGKDEKLKYLRKSADLYVGIKDSTGLSRSYNNTGIYYYESDQLDSALYYYDKAYTITEQLRNDSAMTIVLFNKVSVYAKRGEYDKVLGMYKDQSPIVFKAGKYITAAYYHNLNNLYVNMGMYDSALYHTHKTLDLLKPYPKLLRNTYSLLSELYEKTKEDYIKALVYQRKADSLNEIILTNNNSNLLSMLEAQYQAELKEERINKLNLEMDKANNSRFFLIVLLITFSVFTVVIVWQIRQKAQKKREKIRLEQKLMAAELHNSEMKRQYLNDELKYANKELTVFAANIVQNKEILSDLKKNVSLISRQENSETMKGHLQKLNIKLLQHLYNDDQREQFVKRASELNRSLIYNIKNRFPEITDKDLNLLILILIKFDYKEIASMYNISSRSVIQRRYRLRKKLGLDSKQTFEDFFDKFIPELDRVDVS